MYDVYRKEITHMRKMVAPTAGDEFDADQLLDIEMQKYAGKWVAVVSHKVVAVGVSVKSVVEQATAKGHKKPLVMRAPEQGIWIV